MTIPHAPTLPGITTSGNDPDMRAAYWDAVALLDAGWQLRKLRFIAATNAGAVDVCTPTHRSLTITSTDRRLHVNLPNTHLALRLARTVAILGRRDVDSLSDLAWQLSSRAPAGSKALVSFGHTVIPDPRLNRQPVNLRTAFWLLAVLACDYQWRISGLGEDVAGGGFVADIPGDVTAIYPAAMPLDGTAAAALARLLPSLDQSSLQYLRRLSPVQLTKAHADRHG